jgi:hypothetical protein
MGESALEEAREPKREREHWFRVALQVGRNHHLPSPLPSVRASTVMIN